MKVLGLMDQKHVIIFAIVHHIVPIILFATLFPVDLVNAIIMT